jgi:uncharacterized protein
MPHRFFLIVALFWLAPAAQAADIVGAWQGTWTKAGDALPVALTFAKSDGKIIGAFDSDALRVTGIPFESVTSQGNAVRFVLRGDETQTLFSGTLAGSRLTGTFEEGELKGEFALSRAESLAPLPTREVTFANGAATLSGELILPSTPGKHAAILFLHGSGAEGRWASRFLAQKFARAGFVALIYDKRGVGKSTRDWQKSGFEDLTADAVSGIRLLAAQPEVDPKHIGVYGHSQGGTIAPFVAERLPSLSFVIGSAASGVSPAECEIYSIENLLGVPNLPTAERADAQRFVREIVAVAYEGKARKTLDAMDVEFNGRSWYFKPPPPSDAYWALSRRTAAYRPLDHWRRVRAPVLLLFGANDQRVPPARSGEAIVAALTASGNTKVTLKIFPNADHSFRIVPRTPPNGWPKSVPDYVDTLVDWARAQN